MPAARTVASKNIVLASERMPAQFRPSNQLRLQRALPANPALHASTSFMPSFLEYQGANQWGDMGLGQRVVKSANRDLGVKPQMLSAPGPTRLPVSDATLLSTANAEPATTPQMSPAAVNGLGYVSTSRGAPMPGMGSISRGAPMPGMGSISRGAPMPGMGAISATSPFVLGALGLGVIGIAAILIFRKKRR